MTQSGHCPFSNSSIQEGSVLLRRVLTHFRSQDWLAIWLDFVIVVVGIFVGLQADQWNQSRKERVLEQQYITSLKSDLISDIEELDRTVELARSRAQLGRLVHAAVEQRSVSVDPNEFIWAVYNTDLLNYPSYTRATVDELLSTGNLRLLRNSTLKSEIAAYYTEIKKLEQWKTNWRETQIALEHTFPNLLDFRVREAATLRYVGGPEWLTEEFEFDASVATDTLHRILEHPTAIGQIENMTRVQDFHYLNLIAIRERTVSLINLLE